MKTCPHCGEEIPADAKTCPECQKPAGNVEQTPAQKKKTKKAEGEDALSLNDQIRAVQKAVSDKFSGATGPGAWAEVVYEDSVIVQVDGKMVSMAWTFNLDGQVELGEPVEVRQAYVPVTEGSIIGPLGEDGRAFVREAGAAPNGKQWSVLIIKEGMSKNRNRYGSKCLKKAAPLYEGARIYMDHQEDERRYGRSTKDVAGFLKNVRPVTLGDGGTVQEGIGGGRLALAATACITKPAVREMLVDAYEMGKPDLFGLSHDVRAESVTVMGQDGPFYDVLRIESVSSVDFVTNPAAGGRVLRLVASDTIPTTLERDGTMLQKMIEAIKASGNAGLVAKLEALGGNPTEDQVLAIYQEALKGAAVAGQKTEAAPAQSTVQVVAAQVAPVAQVTEALASMEARLLESQRDGLVNFLEAQLAGCALAAPVKDHLRNRLTAQIGGAVLPTKAQITEAIKEQVDLFGKLAEGSVKVPGAGRAEVTKTTVDQLKEALDDFFDPKKPAQSIRQLYVQVTGDTNVTGRVKEAQRLTEALNSTSFDQILGDSITRRMVAEYNLQPLDNWRGVVAEVVPVADFRTQRRMRFGGYGNLPTVNQGATYQALTSPTDEEATYVPAKRGGTETLTIEMIANDDVGAVRRIPTRLARAAAQTLHEFVWDFLATNANIYDSSALAVAGHGSNIITTALSASNLSTARLRMKQQADMSNAKRIGLDAKYLIVPTELEELAFQLTTSDRAVPDSSLSSTAAAAAPNFLKKLGITPVVVPYWTDTNNWWVTASPDQVPMIEIGFLGGRQEPELFVQDVPNQGSLFSNDQITYKIRHTYGGAVLDFRGFVGGIVP